MVLCNEAEASALSAVYSLPSQTRSTLKTTVVIKYELFILCKSCVFVLGSNARGIYYRCKRDFMKVFVKLLQERIYFMVFMFVYVIILRKSLEKHTGNINKY